MELSIFGEDPSCPHVDHRDIPLYRRRPGGRAPGQPDIAYAPDFEKYQARTARRLAEGNIQKTLPERFPKELTGDLVWEGETLADAYDWTYVLSDEQLEEIETALQHFKCKYYLAPKRLSSVPPA